MDEKTKAKTEAMAFINTSEGTSQAIYKEGATPWAEWCKRFEKHLVNIIKNNGLDFAKTDIALLKEYRQWLEDVDGKV